MGGCFSKKGPSKAVVSATTQDSPNFNHKVPDLEASNSLNSSDPAISRNINFIVKETDSAAAPVRVSSCSKEEVEAILIQCGRLSRSSSGKAVSGSPQIGGNRSKRSYDFDDDDVDDDERIGRFRASPRGRRRRTPSREREKQNQRSNGGSRRVSRSPGRRSENSAGGNNGNATGRPGKLVSVPATVSSLEPAITKVTNKRNVDDVAQTSGNKYEVVSFNSHADGFADQNKIDSLKDVNEMTHTSCVKNEVAGFNSHADDFAAQNKRGEASLKVVGEMTQISSNKYEVVSFNSHANSFTDQNKRGAASPRAKSPARTHASGTNANPRARSPARGMANAPSENVRARSPARTHASGTNANPRARSPARGMANAASENIRARSPVRTNANGCAEKQKGSSSRNSSRKAEQSPSRRNPLSEIDTNNSKSKEFEANGQIRNVTLTTIPPTLKSQELVENPKTVSNLNPSYASLLLEDIQNFHHKSISISVPPVVESEVIVNDDLRRNGKGRRRGGEEVEEEESTGSNSFVGVGVSSSSYEPNSADSNDRWTSMSKTNMDDQSPLESGIQMEDARRGFSGKRRAPQVVMVAAST